jgi:PKHD-type hydroxylase
MNGNWNSGEWCYFRSYLSKDTCNKIINDALQLPAQDAVVGVNGINVALDTSIRKSKVRFINSGDWRFSYLFDALWKTALQANNDFFNIHITKLDFVQFAEYDARYEGEYKEHHDVFWNNQDPYYHRKLSCVVQLSDPLTYEGGELELTEAGAPVDKEFKDQGSVIYFPSMIRHRAHKVTKGVRYSIAAWFEGPKWR